MSAEVSVTSEIVPNTGGVLSLLSIDSRRHSQIPVTPAMLAAGRAAFKHKRRLLDDLWQAFDCDIDVAVTAIYRAMAKAAK